MNDTPNANNGENYLEDIRNYILGIESPANVSNYSLIIEGNTQIIALLKDDVRIEFNPNKFVLTEWQERDINAFANELRLFFAHNTKIAVNQLPDSRYKIFLYNAPNGAYKIEYGADNLTIDFIEQTTL